MSSFFLIRNLLSVKTALSIHKQYNRLVDPVFSIEAESEAYFNEIKKTVPEKIKTVETLKINYLFNGLTFIKKINCLRYYEKKIESIFKSYNVSDFFVLYPLHEKDALYLKVAKQLGLNISFYEEGSCFYTGQRGREKNFKKEIKFYIKNVLLKMLEINRGYVGEPNCWYSMLPINKKNNKLIKVDFEKLDFSHVNHLFLSRPVSTDFPSISIDLQSESILNYFKILKPGEKVYIKFHPREKEDSRIKILNFLNSKQDKIKCIALNTSFAAEDVLYNMNSGGTVCGFDTSTLIYAKSINPSINVYSVLNNIYFLDKSNELKNLYDCYSNCFKHIVFL